MPIIFALAFLLQSQPAQEPPLVQAKDLQVVSGPMAPAYPDPARGPDYRGMEAEIRISARKGQISLPTRAISKLPLRVEDAVIEPAGWKAYRVEAAPRATVKVRLRGNHEAWFQVKCVDKWGHMTAGMLRNKIPTGNPEASYINPKDEISTVYFIVDTTELSMSGEAYTLTFITSR